LLPENATAQTIPSAFKMVAHMLLLTSPSDVATAPESAVSKAGSAADQIEKRDRRGAPAMRGLDTRQEGRLDLLRPDCIERVAEFSKRAWEHDYLLDLLFNSLCLLYMMRRLSKVQRSQLDKLIGDLWIRLNGTGTRILDVRGKESFVEHLSRHGRLRLEENFRNRPLQAWVST
jgi:integrase